MRFQADSAYPSPPRCNARRSLKTSISVIAKALAALSLLFDKACVWIALSTSAREDPYIAQCHRSSPCSVLVDQCLSVSLIVVIQAQATNFIKLPSFTTQPGFFEHFQKQNWCYLLLMLLQILNT